jgi:hypothetical protein
MKDIQSQIKNSQEDLPTPQQSNSLASIKEQQSSDINQKTTSIPFISKLSKEKKEELEHKMKKSENEKRTEIQDEDEIDQLINKISKNNVSKGTNRGKIIVEDKVKLDFDQDVKVDINKIKSNRFSNITNLCNNITNSNHPSDTNSEINISTNNHTISKYFHKSQVGGSNTTIAHASNDDSTNEKLQSNKNENFTTINTSSITNIPIKNNINNKLTQNIPSSSPVITTNSNSHTASINPSRINYTPIKRIIDTSVVNSQSFITNSDLILCILELCINSVYYGFKYSTKSKVFWENLIKKCEFKNIFVNFKPDTLKKYWITLSETKEFNKAVDLINKNKELIDKKELK